MSLLTVVVPCYNEEEAIPFFYEEMLKTIEVFNKVDPDSLERLKNSLGIDKLIVQTIIVQVDKA